MLVLTIAQSYHIHQDQHSRDRALQTMASMSSAQIVSATAIHNKTSSTGTGMTAGGMPPTVGALRSPNTGSTVSLHSSLTHSEGEPPLLSLLNTRGAT